LIDRNIRVCLSESPPPSEIPESEHRLSDRISPECFKVIKRGLRFHEKSAVVMRTEDGNPEKSAKDIPAETKTYRETSKRMPYELPE
jgi:hypothetical protein